MAETGCGTVAGDCGSQKIFLKPAVPDQPNRRRKNRQGGTTMANPFVHVELATTDIDRAKLFYRSLFDWQLNDVDMGGGMAYTLIGVGEGTGGGMMKHPMPGAPSAWLAYVEVDDLRAATDKAKALGATVVRDITPVMDEGSFAIITDPTGAALGLWQSKRK
jgi:uncharacterized protein